MAVRGFVTAGVHRTPHLDVTWALRDIERALSGVNPERHAEEAIRDISKVLEEYDIPMEARTYLQNALAAIQAGDYSTAVINLQQARAIIPARR